MEMENERVPIFIVRRDAHKMSKVNWTNEQQDAIYEKGSNILVAAAARKW